ncbi:hypothetical protein E2C01_080150 [Portunus trituberculatus]|uniref:Uncharacterized protein n=1 Tax=Portunus trituberculatus TaxID=210409 RepID=A0A5B7IXM8_PORTR|nr:hypothetical protein [Portunus trituberculatus]
MTLWCGGEDDTWVWLGVVLDVPLWRGWRDVLERMRFMCSCEYVCGVVGIKWFECGS